MNPISLQHLLIAQLVEKLLIHGLPASRWNGQEFDYPSLDKMESQISFSHPLDKDQSGSGWGNTPQAYVVPGDVISQLGEAIARLSKLESQS